MEEQKLSVSMSLSHKVNLGNYESAEAFVSISGVTEETTEEDIEALLDGNGKIAFTALKKRLIDRSSQLRKDL